MLSVSLLNSRLYTAVINTALAIMLNQSKLFEKLSCAISQNKAPCTWAVSSLPALFAGLLMSPILYKGWQLNLTLPRKDVCSFLSDDVIIIA